MVDIILTDDQYRQLAKAEGPVRIRNPRGAPIGILTPREDDTAPLKITVEEVEELNRRMRKKDARWFTTAEVVEHLQARTEECSQ